MRQHGTTSSTRSATVTPAAVAACPYSTAALASTTAAARTFCPTLPANLAPPANPTRLALPPGHASWYVHVPAVGLATPRGGCSSAHRRARAHPRRE